MVFKEVRGTDRGLDIEAQLVETLDQRERLFLIFICKGNDNGTIVFHLDARCLQGLKESTVQALVVADGLTGGLHLRRQIRIHTIELLETEGRCLNIPAVGRFRRSQAGDALLFQGLSEHDAGRDRNEVLVCGLGKERNRSRCTRVDLDNIDAVVLVDDELDIEKTHDADAEAQTCGVIADRLFDLI